MMKNEPSRQPSRVFLFSGHMMDVPGRAMPRFPPEKEAAAASRIDEALARHGAGPADKAFCQAAAGGDILFLEACLRKGVQCEVLLPFPQDDFIAQSVLPAANGAGWLRRYQAVIQALPSPPRIMGDADAPMASMQLNAFARCNLWLLDSAMHHGADHVRFICLWNGAPGDGPGGTRHMYDEATSTGATVDWIDTRTL